MKKILAAGIAAGAVLISALPVFAAGSGEWDPPTQALESCNYAHGVFQYFSDPSVHGTPGQPPYFGDDLLGSARGGLTGENNSSYSEYCRTL